MQIAQSPQWVASHDCCKALFHYDRYTGLNRLAATHR